MARRSRPTFNKRQKEMARQQKQQDKTARRQQMKEEKGASPTPPGGEDPEIAGIRPGPQPRPEWVEPDRDKG